MNKKKKISSLLSPEATGGDTAERGFKYQANLIVARISIWLSNDGFTEMIREALGDVEAKFFSPSHGISREYIEYKNHLLQPKEFWSEISNFQQMDEQATGAFHRFILACKGVSDSLKPILNGLRRVRDAFPFYDEAQNIQDESYYQFEERVKEGGGNKEKADFIFSKVWFDIDLVDAEDHPRELFRESLLRAFPIFEEISIKSSNVAYTELVRLVESRLNQPIYRYELENILLRSVGGMHHWEQILRIHTNHESNLKNAPQGSIVFDWEKFFGGVDREFPPSKDWNNELLFQLSETKKWILSSTRPRLVRLSGNRRPSAIFAFGSIFSSVSGFVIQMETKDGLWVTNNYPNSDTPHYTWNEELRDSEALGELAIGIGILKNVIPEVESFLESMKFTGPRLYLMGDSAILSDHHNNSAVDQAKNIILDHLGKHNARKAHLFMATPAQFALFLGHRLNATCVIQCYERKAPNVYFPTCLIQMS